MPRWRRCSRAPDRGDRTDWLTRLGVTEHSTLPASLRGLVRQTREQCVGPAPLRPAKVRSRLPEGSWLVALLIDGADPHDVAAELSLSVHTIRSHIKTIFAKVGVSSRAELTAALASR